MPSSPDPVIAADERVARARAALPAVARYAYLNTGTCGPIPQAAADALTARWRADVAQGRILPDRYPALFAEFDAARDALADLLGAAREEIVLTHSTTHGINIVLWGLRWSPGDEILTTLHEHPGLQVPLADVSRRYGTAVRAVDLDPADPDAAVDAFRRAVTARTRMIAVSHVLWTNGAVLPIRHLADLAREAGAYLLVDGAQSAGALPVRPRELGVHFYSLPGQKWLCGPEGTGALYVAAEALPALEVTFGGYLSQQRVDPSTLDYLPRAGAARFEGVPPLGAAVAGLGAALRWLQGLDLGWVHARTAGLARRLRQGLEQAGLEVLTPDPGDRAPRSGLVSFRVPGSDAAEAARLLIQQGFVVRDIPGRFAAVRASTAFSNTAAEIDALIEAAGRLGS